MIDSTGRNNCSSHVQFNDKLESDDKMLKPKKANAIGAAVVCMQVQLAGRNAKKWRLSPFKMLGAKRAYEYLRRDLLPIGTNEEVNCHTDSSPSIGAEQASY